MKSFCPNAKSAICAIVSMASLWACGDACAGSATYAYDALGRLVQVVRSAGATTTYSYDAAGNRTEEKTSGLKAAAAPAPDSIKVAEESPTR